MDTFKGMAGLPPGESVYWPVTHYHLIIMIIIPPNTYKALALCQALFYALFMH